MKGKFFIFTTVAALALVGCNNGYDGYEYDEYDAYLETLSCGTNGRPCERGDMAAQKIKYATPGNNLVLDTPKYVIQVEGAPNKKYDYYVWTGDKQYSDDPDLIIQDGNAAILVEE